MATESFVEESTICGYHQYKAIWDNPVAGEALVCEHEVEYGVVSINGPLGSGSSLREVFFCMGQRKMNRTIILHDTGQPCCKHEITNTFSGEVWRIKFGEVTYVCQIRLT